MYRNKERIAANRWFRERDRVLTAVLQVIQERQDDRNIQVIQINGGRDLASRLGQKLEEQTESVTIGSDGVSAGSLMSEAMFGKEGLQQGAKTRTHHQSPPTTYRTKPSPD